MARDGVRRIVERFGEHAGDPKAREGRQGERDLVGFEVFAGELTSGPGSPSVCQSGGPVCCYENRITHRYRILLSTHNRSVRLPVYGDPGVDSSMNRPYSG